MSDEHNTPVKRAQRLAQRNLLEEMFALRDLQRETRGKGLWHLHGDDLPWELNRQGFMRWYMHPKLDDVAVNSLVAYVQRIPPGSRSGKQTGPGETVIFILAGRGYTLLNTKKHEWQAGDCINFPVLPAGVTYQHFNTDPEHEALFVVAEPNFADPLGVDRGAVLDQLENCPEYDAQHPEGRSARRSPPGEAAVFAAERILEPGPRPPGSYEESLWQEAARYHRALTGQVVIRQSDRRWTHSRQGTTLTFLNPGRFHDTAVMSWRVFLRNQTAHSGKHRHQGGLVIFVVEGEGYSVVNGERVDWGAGDLLLLPIKPGGIEHQHFSRDPNKPCKWLALIYEPLWYGAGSVMQHVSGEAAPEAPGHEL